MISSLRYLFMYSFTLSTTFWGKLMIFGVGQSVQTEPWSGKKVIGTSRAFRAPVGTGILKTITKPKYCKYNGKLRLKYTCLVLNVCVLMARWLIRALHKLQSDHKTTTPDLRPGEGTGPQDQTQQSSPYQNLCWAGGLAPT